MRQYIICYDITDPRRLGRIHRALKKTALPVQYSVFLFSGTPEQLALCLARLEALMDPASDDIRAYPLPQRGLRLALGPARCPAASCGARPPAVDLPLHRGSTPSAQRATTGLATMTTTRTRTMGRLGPVPFGYAPGLQSLLEKYPLGNHQK